MSNAILTTKLALARWQQDIHHLSTIVHLCMSREETLDEAALQGVHLIIGSMRKEFKLTGQLLDTMKITELHNPEPKRLKKA